VSDFRCLLGDSLDYGVIGVPNGHDPNATCEINEAITVDVFNDSVVSVGSIDRESGGNACGNSPDPTFVQLLGARARNVGEDAC
jgi:hypothetical protein